MNTEKQSPVFHKEGNVSVHYLPCYSLLNGRFPVPKFTAIQFLKHWFNENEADFGIVQCRFYLLSLIGCRVLARHHIPFIQIEHGAGEVIMPNPLVKKLWHIYDNCLTLAEKKIPHDFYAVSRAGLTWLKHYGIQGVDVISNSISPADFSDALLHPEDWRKERGIGEDKTLITFSGRIMKEKGVIDLLKAFDTLQGHNLMLVIAGDGDRKITEPWQNRENILFTGQLPFAEIPRLLAATDIFCLPSHFVEGKPTGVLEAGMCGNAVVVTASGGTLEIVPDDNFGRLVESEDISGLSKALQDLVDNPDERERIGKNLQKRVLERFTWKTAAEDVRKAMRRYGL